MATMSRRVGEMAADDESGTPSRTETLDAAEAPGLQVASEAAEAFIEEKRIGERIKYLRLKKGMGLVELGRHTGLSASFLSQLETGRVVPTLRNLARIAMVFSKDLSYFFEPEPQAMLRVHRAKDRVRTPQTGAEDPDYFFESLGYLVPDRGLNPYFAEFLPAKEGREARAHQHAGASFCMCFRDRWICGTARWTTIWTREMRCTSTRPRRTPIFARARNRPTP